MIETNQLEDKTSHIQSESFGHLFERGGLQPSICSPTKKHTDSREPYIDPPSIFYFVVYLREHLVYETLQTEGKNMLLWMEEITP